MLNCWILLLLSTLYVQAQGRFSRAILDSPWTIGKPFRIHFTWEGEEKWGSLHLPISKSLQIIDSDFNAPARIDAANKEIKKSWSKYYTVKSPVSGAITLPSAHITLGGKTYSIAPQKIYIQKNTVPASQAGSRIGEPFMLEENTFLLPGESPERKTPELVFIRIETNKRFCYIGEDLLVTYKLYTSVDSRSEVLKRPSFNGFSVLDVLKTYDAEPVAEWLNGKAYYTHIIRKVHLFPLREGDLSLDEAIIQTSIEYKENKHHTNSNSRGNTESIVSIPYTTTIHSAPHKVTVKALPSHAESKNVNGAVGHFSLELSTDKPVYATGEQGVLRLHIYGEGNWPLIGIPEIQWPSSLKHMEPEITESYDPHSYPLRGEKAFIHRFVAQDTGQWYLPPIHMVYFDPQSSKYITIRSKPLPIKVTLTSGNSTERSGPPNAEKTSSQGNSMVILYFSILLLAILGRIVYMIVKKNSPEKEEVGRP